MPDKPYEPDRFEISSPTDELSQLFPKGEATRSPHGRVCLAVVLDGRAMAQIDGKNYLLYKRTLLFLTPGHLLLQLSQSEDFLFQYLSFDFDFLSDFPLLLKPDIINDVGNMPHLQADEPTFRLVRRYYDFISNRNRECANRTEVTKGLLFSFILEMSQIYSGRSVSVKVSRQNELADGFFSLLHKNYRRERTAAFYAGRLCISDKHLMRSIKKQTGQTFHFWVTDFIVREAKLLLKSTDMSVTEITDELNFPNSSFFARFFRKHTGLSPIQFRNER